MSVNVEKATSTVHADPATPSAGAAATDLRLTPSEEQKLAAAWARLKREQQRLAARGFDD